MAWTDLTFSFGAILTSAQMTQLDANFDALAAGGGGAPAIQYAALATDIGPWHTIDTQTASASATVEFIDGVGGVVFDSTYDEYRVVITHLIPATDNTSLNLTVTEDGGTSWVSTNYSQIAATSGTTSTTITVAETELRPLTGDGMGNLSTEGCSVEILLKNPSTADRMDHVVVVSGGLYKDQNGAALTFDGATGFIDRDVAYNGIKFAMNSGNIASGVFTLQGRRY